MAQKQQPGQIIDRGPNKHLVRIYLGTDGNGKRQYVGKTVTGTITQARQELTKMLRERDTETFVKPSKRTVQDFLSSWLTAKSNLEIKTKLDYEHRLTKDVYPYLGGLQLSQLSPEHIRMLYGKLAQSDRALSPRTIRYTHSILTNALSVAVEDGLLSRNPCDRKSVRDALPKKIKTEPLILSPDNIEKIMLGESDLQLHTLWRLLIVTGMRPQEALVLRWTDLASPNITIRRTIGEIAKGGEVVKEYGKTEGSSRTIALDSDTILLLQKHRTAQATHIMKVGKKYVRQDYIFATRTGAFLSRSNARRYWHTALLRVGLPKSKLYITRHTRASLGIANNEDVQSVAALLGHADATMTLRVYTHTVAGRGEENATKFSALLSRKKA